jgi:hypothetical protein
MSVGILKIQGLLIILKDLIESQQGIIVSIKECECKVGFNVGGSYEKFNDSRDRKMLKVLLEQCMIIILMSLLRKRCW